MICPKCNSEIKNRSNFCSKCGAKCNTIATASQDQGQKSQKQGNFLFPITIMIIGGLITYLSVFHDAFGGASGFMAVVGGFILLVTVIYLAHMLGMSDEEINAAIKKANEKAQRERDIREANRIWNDAQRENDRRYKK